MNFQNRRQSLKRMHVQPMQMKWKFFFSCWLVICFFPHPFDCWIFILPFFFFYSLHFVFLNKQRNKSHLLEMNGRQLKNAMTWITMILFFLFHWCCCFCFFFFCKIVTGTFVPDERQTIDQKCTENTDEETSYCRDLSSETLWCLCWICLV